MEVIFMLKNVFRSFLIMLAISLSFDALGLGPVINPLYFDPVRKNLSALSKQTMDKVVNAPGCDTRTLASIVASEGSFAPLRKMCERQQQFKGLMAQLQLFDTAYASRNAISISQAGRNLIEYLTTCQSTLTTLQRQQRESVLEGRRNNKDGSQSAESSQESLSDQLRRQMRQQEGAEEQLPLYAQMLQGGLQWLTEHPWQAMLAVLSCYILYARWTGSWPFNHDGRESNQQSAQHAQQPPASAPNQHR